MDLLWPQGQLRWDTFDQLHEIANRDPCISIGMWVFVRCYVAGTGVGTATSRKREIVKAFFCLSPAICPTVLEGLLYSTTTKDVKWRDPKQGIQGNDDVGGHA